MWVMGQFTDGSDGSWVTWVRCQFTDGSDGSWVMWVMGQFTDGSDGSLVTKFNPLSPLQTLESNINLAYETRFTACNRSIMAYRRRIRAWWFGTALEDASNVSILAKCCIAVRSERRRRSFSRRSQNRDNNTQQQPFYGRLSGTTRVNRYQKKHSPTHHPDHHPIFISFFHLPRSVASSLFKLRDWQSFCTTSFHVTKQGYAICCSGQ